MSVWVGGWVVLAADLCVSVPAPFLVWFAASSVTGLSANVEARAKQRYQLADIELRRGRSRAAGRTPLTWRSWCRIVR